MYTEPIPNVQKKEVPATNEAPQFLKTDGTPAAAAGASNGDKPQAPAKQSKRFYKIEDARVAMQEAFNEDFSFISTVNDVDGASYRYAHVDGRELVIVLARQ